jgi:hypothetical protein
MLNCLQQTKQLSFFCYVIPAKLKDTSRRVLSSSSSAAAAAAAATTTATTD